MNVVLRSLRLSVLLVLVMGVVLQVVCRVDAKGRERKGRRKRCPKACVQKFNNYQKGPQGPAGPRGTKGGRLVLPICRPDEYLTSDGVNLKCRKFDFTNVCSDLKKQCRSTMKDDPETGVTRPNGGGKLMQFTKNNMIQEMDMDTWDAEAFYIGPSLFVGLSHLGMNAFHLYKWEESGQDAAFKLFQEFKTSFSRNWCPFKIAGVQYFIIAIQGRRRQCPIFRWNSLERKFVTFGQTLPCTRAYDVAAFRLAGVQHIVISNYVDGSYIGIYKWNGTRFETVQKIFATAMFVQPFEIGSDTYIALSANQEMAPIVTLYKWNGNSFVSNEMIYTDYRPYEVTSFTAAGNQHFLAIATISIESILRSTIVLLKWNGKKFQTFQNITSVGARRVSAISSPLMGEENTYIAAVNDRDNPAIYVLDRDHGNSFKLLQIIMQEKLDKDKKISHAPMKKGARDISFFEMGSSVYLLMSTHGQMCVYKGVAVSSQNTGAT